MGRINNPLIGKWQMVCWKVNAAGGWKSLKSYSDGQSVWDFCKDGTLIESALGERPSTTKYYFYLDKSLLAIDRSDYADDGFVVACIEEHYRVEFLSNRYIVLHDLEDVEVKPDDYTIKMELEKM